MVQRIIPIWLHTEGFGGGSYGARRKGQRGSAAVELALVLPMLCLLVIGGWVAGYAAFAKAALAMAAGRAARDFAAAVALHERLEEPDRAYRYDGGFAESFGLPRWAVRAAIMRTQVAPGRAASDQAVVVAMCYRLPLRLPGGLLAGPPEAEAAPSPGRAVHELPDLVGFGERAAEEYRSAWREVQQEVDEWAELLRRAEAVAARAARLTEQGRRAASVWRQVIEGPPADFTPLDGPAPQGPDDLEQAVRRLCEPAEGGGRSLIVTARAAYLLQTVFEPGGGEGP